MPTLHFYFDQNQGFKRFSLVRRILEIGGDNLNFVDNFLSSCLAPGVHFTIVKSGYFKVSELLLQLFSHVTRSGIGGHFGKKNCSV